MKVRLASRGFTLIELLVVITIIALLAALLCRPSPAGAPPRPPNAAARCGESNSPRSSIRRSRGFFPGNKHSANANDVYPWERAIAPYMGQRHQRHVFDQPSTRTVSFPADLRSGRPLSYGLNVYFQLEGPNYLSCHRIAQVPKPAATIAYTEILAAVDHVMPEDWTQLSDAMSDVASTRTPASPITFSWTVTCCCCPSPAPTTRHRWICGTHPHWRSEYSLDGLSHRRRSARRSGTSPSGSQSRSRPRQC